MRKLELISLLMDVHSLLNDIGIQIVGDRDGYINMVTELLDASETEDFDYVADDDDDTSFDSAPPVAWPNVSNAPVCAPPVSWPNVSHGVSDTFTQSSATVSAPVATPVVSKPPAGVVMRPVGTHSHLAYRDNRGRACVPQVLTLAVGLAPGDPVHIARRAHGLDGVVLLKNAPATGLLSTYLVDKDGNVRLCRGLLDKAIGMSNTDVFKFSLSRDGRAIVGRSV